MLGGGRLWSANFLGDSGHLFGAMVFFSLFSGRVADPPPGGAGRLRAIFGDYVCLPGGRPLITGGPSGLGFVWGLCLLGDRSGRLRGPLLADGIFSSCQAG